MNAIVSLLIVGVAYYLWTTPRLPSFQLIYASWCPHCKSVLPAFKAFKYPGVSISWIESKYSKLDTPGVPTWVYTDADGGSEIYSGPRDAAGWNAYLASKNLQHT